MLTKIMKWSSIVVLLQPLLWLSSANYQLLLEFVVCAGAILVALDAAREEKYFWTTGFVAIALLFNPVSPVVLSRTMFLWLGWASVATFLASLIMLRAKPMLSMPRRDHELW